MRRTVTSQLVAGASPAGAPVPPARRLEVAVPSGQLSAVAWGGAAPQAVLLHGLGREAHDFDAVATALDLPVVALDLPGHGESSWRLDGRYVAATIGPDVATALRALAAGPVVLAGHSLGGLVAIAAAAAEPALVAGLVLVDVTPGIDLRRVNALRAVIAGPQSFASVEEVLATLAPFGSGRRGSAERLVGHNIRRLADGRLAWKHHLAQLPPEQLSAGDVASLWEPLERFAGPVALVSGEDGFLTRADREELARRLPAAEAVEVAGGHDVLEEHPLRVAGAIRSLLTAPGRDRRPARGDDGRRCSPSC